MYRVSVATAGSIKRWVKIQKWEGRIKRTWKHVQDEEDSIQARINMFYCWACADNQDYNNSWNSTYITLLLYTLFSLPPCVLFQSEDFPRLNLSRWDSTRTAVWLIPHFISSLLDTLGEVLKCIQVLKVWETLQNIVISWECRILYYNSIVNPNKRLPKNKQTHVCKWFTLFVRVTKVNELVLITALQLIIPDWL